MIIWYWALVGLSVDSLEELDLVLEVEGVEVEGVEVGVPFAVPRRLKGGGGREFEVPEDAALPASWTIIWGPGRMGPKGIGPGRLRDPGALVRRGNPCMRGITGIDTMGGLRTGEIEGVTHSFSSSFSGVRFGLPFLVGIPPSVR